MMRSAPALILVGCLLTAANALSIPHSLATTRGSEIQWFSCGDFDSQYSIGDELNVTCGYYEVPLDWADESVGTAKLAVARYPAIKERWGTMFANPGGPGGSGIEHVVTFGLNMSDLSGGHYDIVSWDPRGVGHTTPGPVTCFASAEEQAEYFKGTLEDTWIEIKGNLTDDNQLEEFYSHVDQMEVVNRGFGERCANSTSGKDLPYVGSAAGARDMVALADYLDPGVQEINYYGISYGSMLGFIFVNMFPDRVGHVVLDGCMNPVLYGNKPSADYVPNYPVGADETFAGFASGCALAGKDGCPLVANDNDTAADVTARLQGMLDLAHELLEAGADMSQTITSAQARAYVHNTLYWPMQWADLANFAYVYELSLQAIAANMSESQLTKRQPSLASWNREDIPTTAAHTYEQIAIVCGDGIDAGNATMRDVFDAIAYTAENVSPMFGPQWNPPARFCWAWPARAAERFTGPWDNELKNPILIIGNTADPVTPFANAQLMAELLGDSAVLLEQDGFGHTSIAEKSSCTSDIFKKYFEDGSLPEGDNTHCEIDDSVILFPNSTVTQASAKRNLLAAGRNDFADQTPRARFFA
ncbi:Alpha/Beta hydrolase protein [Schizophyllum amplum]|uniref:Alpha/Beta hydrolase protein n=1 Tax=Schizophyllum amplum TaxID=97359 RepID=A0A550C5H2_9AGAR|nr:Alpha/Beta hydrolase protein [Auriculariopsis ampla]